MNTTIVKMLEQHHIKATPMRMLVLEQLMVLNRHVALLELETILYPADRITIYRTLQTFVTNGLAHTVERSGQGMLYALCRDNCNVEVHRHNHPHFFCTKCQLVTCNTDYVIHVEQKNADTKYQLEKLEVSLRGLCPNCAP